MNSVSKVDFFYELLIFQNVYLFTNYFQRILIDHVTPVL